MIIAVDGTAASGKGTLAKALASHFHLRHLDTGLLYRGVAAAMLAAGRRLDDAESAAAIAATLDPAAFDVPMLKSHAVGEAASIVSAHPAVREALIDLQRRFAADPAGAILDGRDIGTVICPQADVKLFVDAAPQERARRRAAELRAKDPAVDEAAILADILRRDARDRNRAVAPLRPAPEAHLLDTTDLDIEAAIRAAIDIVEAHRAGRGRG